MLGTLIGLGVGIDYALFIVTRHRAASSAACRSPRRRGSAVNTSGRAVLFAGGTVCIALLGMLILRLSFLDGVAIAASLTVVLTRRRLGHPAARAARRSRHAGAEPPPARAGSPSTGPQPERGDRRRRPLVGLRRAPPRLLGVARGRRDGGPRDPRAVAAPRLLRPGQQPVVDHHPAGVRPARRRLRARLQRPADPRRRDRRRRRRPDGPGRSCPTTLRATDGRRRGRAPSRRRAAAARVHHGRARPPRRRPADGRADRPAARRRASPRRDGHHARRRTSAG